MSTVKEDALELMQRDQEVVRALMEGNSEQLGRALVAYFELRQSLKARMLDEPVIQLDNQEAAEILRKIIGGEGLPSDKLLERLAGDDPELLFPSDFDDAELDKLGFDLFYSWYSHAEYITALSELRPLILRCDVPENVSRLLDQVKRCYAFQQYDAAYGLCRTLLEAAIRDICVRCRFFPDKGPNVVIFENYRWRELRDRVSSGPLREQLRDLYARLCEVLHARRSVGAGEARGAFSQTLVTIEQLYEQNGL